MQTTNHKTDAIIIGGGLAGLTAAAFIARQGKSVRLLEQATALGGRARTKEQDGYFLNIGAHALYRAGHGIAVLRELGIEPQGKPAATANAYAVQHGVKYTLPGGLVSLLTTSLFGLSAKMELGKLLGSVQKIDCQPLLKMTVREWLKQQISHDEVSALLQAVIRLSTYVNAPDLMSAGVAISQLQKALSQGVLYLDKGWQTLVDGVREVAVKAGAVIETGAKVERIERHADGSVKAVRLADGRLFESNVVVIAASPKLAVSLVENGETTALQGWADQAIAVKAACLDLALKRLPVEKATFALGIDQPFYLSVHSAAAQLAPAGGALIHLMKYLPAEQNEANEADERGLEALMDLLQPGWREVLTQRRFLPSVVVMHALPLAKQGGTQGRPEVEVKEVPGLFVAGDWVGKEGVLVDASLASAKLAAEKIAAYHPVSRAVAV
ncbi:MAG: NAD(P)/FAD-dependent oxidoreductase [Acidobacteria bacterium]|nr:NAD(P)/FAD-dependent oxidoreductase [Acidobacteriota bacterium]